MMTKEVLQALSEDDALENHAIVYLQASDTEDLLFAVNEVLKMPKVKMNSGRFTRFTELRDALLGVKRSF